MSAIRDEITHLIVDKVAVDKSEVTDDVDINRGLGCTGDDFHDLIDELTKKFNVDMTGYLWYFHTEEEGFNSLGSYTVSQ